MTSWRFVRLSGAAAVIGGIVLAAFSLLAALKPVGCVGVTCVSRSMRYTTDLAPLLVPAGALLLAALVGVIVRAHLAAGMARTLRAGLWLVSVGAAVLVAAVVIESFFYGGDYPHMPNLVIAGVAALGFGMILLAIAVFKLMPRHVGLLLGIGTVTLVFSNEQDARVLLILPFAIACVALGYEQWIAGGREYLDVLAPPH